MQVTFGKYVGKSSQFLVLKEPGYIRWALGQSANGPMAKLQAEAKRHIHDFDAKPFKAVCAECKQPAVRATAYQNNTDLVAWCANCDPYSLGANSGKLTVLTTWSQALRHVEFTCANRKGDQAAIIKELGRLKGAPARLGDVQAVSFLP